MAVCVAHQIIQDIHAIIDDGIQPNALLNSIQIVIDGIDIVSHLGHHGIPLRCHNGALGDHFPVIEVFFISNLRNIEALTNFTCQQLPANYLFTAIF